MPRGTFELEALFSDLRRVERIARAELQQGCAQDVARIEYFFTRLLNLAERDAATAFAAMGSGLDSELARNLRRETFDRIGLDFIERVWANVGLRIRARFRMYAAAISEAEARIAEAISLLRVTPIRHPLPRMFAIHRLAMDDVQVPSPPEVASDIDAWLTDLHRTAREQICVDIEKSLNHVLRQGADRLGVVKTRIDLAVFAPHPTTEARTDPGLIAGDLQ